MLGILERRVMDASLVKCLAMRDMGGAGVEVGDEDMEEPALSESAAEAVSAIMSLRFDIRSFGVARYHPTNP